MGVLTSLELSTPGTFYVDETNSLLYLRPYSGTDMSTCTIEVATRSKLLAVNNRANLTVRNLIIEKGRGSLQEAGSNILEINSSRKITLDGVIVRMAASSAFGGFRNNNLTIRNCKFNNNGISSLGQNGNINTLFEDSEIAGNNWRGWDATHKDFGENNKFFSMRSLTVRRVMYVDNYGHGLWLDCDNKDVLIDRIFSARNKLSGMYNEANQGPVTVQNSKFCGNESAGVSSASGSMNFNLVNNQIFDNLLGQIVHTGQPNPITVPEWDTRKIITLSNRNHNCQSNIVVGYGNPQYFLTPPEGWMIWSPWRGQLAGWLASYKGNYNKYFHRNTTVAFAGGDKSGAGTLVKMDFNTWRTNYANDASNSNKNNEANSTWEDPGPLSDTPDFPNTFDPAPPSMPTALAAIAVSSSQINLSWSASTDNVGVAGYKIFRGGAQIAVSTANSYSNTGLAASTTCSYTVSAFDASGNNSLQSIVNSATTLPSSILRRPQKTRVTPETPPVGVINQNSRVRSRDS